jgi:hypothetical protein
VLACGYIGAGKSTIEATVTKIDKLVVLFEGLSQETIRDVLLRLTQEEGLSYTLLLTQSAARIVVMKRERGL